MLGEQISERKGKVISQRVVSTGGPVIETTVSTIGSFKGMPVKGTVTFVSRPTSVAGVLYGEGKAVIMTEESEMATSTAKGFGSLSPSGSVKWRGAHFILTSSTSKLAFLNNVVGVFEAEIDAVGNVTEKIWEWK
jgi:hypothetical protein